MFRVYILHSATLDKYYVGFTSMSMEDRMERHLTKHKGYTGRAKDWKLVYVEIFEERPPAIRREKEIKGWKSGQRIRELIADMK